MTDWQDRAACIGEDPEIFFPGRFGDTATAKVVCARCEVRDECLEFGLYERYGVWGGTGERERRELRKQRALLRVAS